MWMNYIELVLFFYNQIFRKGNPDKSSVGCNGYGMEKRDFHNDPLCIQTFFFVFVYT